MTELRELGEALPAAARRGLFGENAARLYRL
jgi:predicted TIM-barrel fold metal-dependent hydrolase